VPPKFSVIHSMFHTSKPPQTQSTPHHQQPDWFQSQQFPTPFFPSFHHKPTDPSDHANVTSVRIHLMHHFHRPGLTTTYHTTLHTRRTCFSFPSVTPNNSRRLHWKLNPDCCLSTVSTVNSVDVCNSGLSCTKKPLGLAENWQSTPANSNFHTHNK